MSSADAAQDAPESAQYAENKKKFEQFMKLRKIEAKLLRQEMPEERKSGRSELNKSIKPTMEDKKRFNRLMALNIEPGQHTLTKPSAK